MSHETSYKLLDILYYLMYSAQCGFNGAGQLVTEEAEHGKNTDYDWRYSGCPWFMLAIVTKTQSWPTAG